MAADKLILALRGPLLHKYGPEGLRRIERSIALLQKADARRGLTTQTVFLDEAGDMADALPATPSQACGAREVKGAIDRLCRVRAPHYLLLLGGPDVMPMVPLRNPAFGPEGDNDRTVPSDLPYACDAAWSLDASRFMGPTRVVGRLPDLMGAADPALLCSLLTAAARSAPRPRGDYQTAFSISAQAWQRSTELSAANTFGAGSPVHTVPPAGYKWSKTQLGARMHLINCHGGADAQDYYGQAPGVQEFPVAHHAPWLRDKLSAGTVVAAECCYGAQLWDPADGGGHLPMPLVYLRDGASAFFGSTTVAYGPSEGNGSADLVCQYFLQQVLAGASTGRAVLEARQKFAGGKTHLDPFDLKTLAQFYLLGDPSVQPVAIEAHALSRTKAFKQAFKHTQDSTVRGLRREKLTRDGRHLGKSLPPLRDSSTEPSAEVAAALQAMARESGLRGPLDRLSYRLGSAAKASGQTPRHLHVLKGRKAVADSTGPVTQVVALVATEQDGQLIHVRRLHSR